MASNINAIAMILIIILVAAVLIKFWNFKLQFSTIFFGIFVSLIVSFLSYSLTLHKCDAGTPLFQWLIPSFSIFLIIVFTNLKKLKTILVILLIVFSFVLSKQYISIIHSEGYTGNPDSIIFKEGENKALKRWHSFFSWIYRVKGTDK